MKNIKRRLEKVECAITGKDTPCLVIKLEPGQSEEEAVAAFCEEHPNILKPLVLLD